MLNWRYFFCYNSGEVGDEFYSNVWIYQLYTHNECTSLMHQLSYQEWCWDLLSLRNNFRGYVMFLKEVFINFSLPCQKKERWCCSFWRHEEIIPVSWLLQRSTKIANSAFISNRHLAHEYTNFSMKLVKKKRLIFGDWLWVNGWTDFNFCRSMRNFMLIHCFQVRGEELKKSICFLAPTGDGTPSDPSPPNPAFKRQEAW